MVSSEDWNAAMSSVVFREYLKNELAKEAQEQTVLAQPDKDKVLEEFEKFESFVRSNPKIKQTFAALKDKFVNDPEYAKKVDPRFVQGVMLLDLDGVE